MEAWTGMDRGDGLLSVVLHAAPRSGPEHIQARRERQQAVRDLLEEGSFRPHGLDGPFLLRLAFRQHRITFDVRNRHGSRLREFTVPLHPLRPAIRDYQLIVDAHFDAAEQGGMMRLQAIDQARRSIHDEAAVVLMAAMAKEAALDHNTARRLFTLIHVVEMQE